MEDFTFTLNAAELRVLRDALNCAAAHCAETGDDLTGAGLVSLVERKFSRAFTNCDAPLEEEHPASCYTRPHGNRIEIIDAVMQCPRCGWVRPKDSDALICPICSAK